MAVPDIARKLARPGRRRVPAGRQYPARPGGAVLAHGTSLEELEKRVENDPFVAENVVTAEIIEIAPGMADERLSFLL
ncbi:hypothetical protein [Nonomuraea sp. NPDC003201]